MNLEDFVLRYPGAPQIPRGERQIITVALSREEYEAVQKLAYHPATRSMYGGALQNVVRHSLHAYLWDMISLLEEGFRPIADILHDQLETDNLFASEETINEVLERKARRFNLLLDHAQYGAALEEYGEFLAWVARLGPVWAEIVHRFMDENRNFSRFRTRAADEDAIALQTVEEIIH